VGDRPKHPGAVVSFDQSLTPMLIVNDQGSSSRNTALCLLLRLHSAMEENWGTLMREGVLSGPFELLMPDGPRMHVEFSATANVEPGRHLSIFTVPPTNPDVVPEQSGAQRLTVRERQVLICPYHRWQKNFLHR
jgi:hypothetical protein